MAPAVRQQAAGSGQQERAAASRQWAADAGLDLSSSYSVWLPTPWDDIAHILVFIFLHYIESDVEIPSQACPAVTIHPVKLTTSINYHMESLFRLLVNNTAVKSNARQQLDSCRTWCLTV